MRRARISPKQRSSEKLIAKLLSEMIQVKSADRTAHFTTVMCAVLPNGKVLSERGECHGIILDSPKGTGGFGYDPVFYYPPLDKTFAEIETAEKNKVSHRAIAFDKLIKALGAIDEKYFIPKKNNQQ